MKNILKIAAAASVLALMLVPDVTYAQAGHMHRATRRRTAVVVGSTVKAEDAAKTSQSQQQTAAAQQQAVASQQQAAVAQQQAAASQQQAAAAEKEAAAAKQEAAAAKQETAIAQGLLPLGTVVSTLPAGCVSTAVSGVEYYHCGVNYYRAVFQGNNLVYVTAQPK